MVVGELTVPDVEEMLLVLPKSPYEVELGKKESIDLGRFQGNALDLVSVTFDVLLATTEALKHVEITGSFDTNVGKVSLKIDLSDFSPTLAGSTISG